MGAFIEENCIARLAKVTTIDHGSATAQTLFTVPNGFRFIPDHVKIENPPALCWQYGAHGVTIEVDIETGRIKVLKVSAAHDVGRALNPANCEGQIQGGFVQALGGTILEEMHFGGKGRMLNASFADYKIPASLDAPDINAILVEEPHREGPYGAIGVGEVTLVPVAPAIANAIYDAVGVRIKDLPITHEKILKALKEKQV